MSYHNRNDYTATVSPRLISDKQVTFARALMADRLKQIGFDSVDAAAEAMGLATLDIRNASLIIDRLKALPVDPDPSIPEVVTKSARWGRGNRPGICTACGCPVSKDEGFYFLTGDGKWGVHHRVDECSQSAPVARQEVEEGFYLTLDGEIVQVYITKQNRRLAGKVMSQSTGNFVYQMGAVRMAEAGGVRLTPEQVANAQCIAKYGSPIGSPELLAKAQQHSVASGYCMFCGKTLDDPRSNPALGGAGYGPVCAVKYSLPWG